MKGLPLSQSIGHIDLWRDVKENEAWIIYLNKINSVHKLTKGYENV
jgi:hypothetical protein